MNKFNIGDEVEVLQGESYYYGRIGIVYAREVDVYWVGFPNSDSETYDESDLKRHYEDYEPVGVSYDFDSVFMHFTCEEDPIEESEEPEELSTTSENLYDIIDHIRSLEDSGAQAIKVTIDSEKQTFNGDRTTRSEFAWECDLDE